MYRQPKTGLPNNWQSVYALAVRESPGYAGLVAPPVSSDILLCPIFVQQQELYQENEAIQIRKLVASVQGSDSEPLHLVSDYAKVPSRCIASAGER